MNLSETIVRKHNQEVIGWRYSSQRLNELLLKFASFNKSRMEIYALTEESALVIIDDIVFKVEGKQQDISYFGTWNCQRCETKYNMACTNLNELVIIVVRARRRYCEHDVCAKVVKE